MKLVTSTLVFCVAGLLALGMVMLYSASMADNGHYLTMQLLWCVLGLAGCGTAAWLDYRMLRKFAWPLLGVSFLLLLLVLVPHIGVKVKGARRWLSFGSYLRLQPSELAKIALIIAVAWYGEHFQRQMGTWKKGIMFPGLFVAPLLALIFVEPDRGTTILLACVAGAMLLVAGVQWKFIVPPVAVALVGLGLSLWHDPMRIRRIFAWLYLDEHKKDIGYQANQALLAFGSGGWFGLGLGNSRQKLGFLPEHNTDFILPIIGEELGLITTLLVVLAFVLIFLCGIYIAYRASDPFGMLLASGITLLIGLQAVINIGVVTSALPNKGLPLPFISYGGSSLSIMLFCVGLLLSVARKARVTAPAPTTAIEPEGLAEPQAA